tara:strand:- start:170 stop:1411 length:1242 start_codon:yes stop_codon:yes gene_type:complete
MANKKKEVAEEVTDIKAPMGDEVKVKVKPKMKKFTTGSNDGVTKVDLSKSEKEVEENQKPEEVKEEQSKKTTDDKVIEEVQEKVEEEKVEGKETENKEEETEQPVLEEITEETTDETIENKVEEVKETVEEAVEKAEQTGQDLPENIQKVIDFMNETGGDLEDYVKLNQDYTKLDDMSLLRQYYNQTKPHLNGEEINFLIEDSFSYDEDIDEAIDIKRKKLAFKEQVANARSHLDKMKSNYYEEIKSGVKLTPDQQKAIDFYNSYTTENKKSQKTAEQQKLTFMEKTNSVFDAKFKGFEYNVGDKRFRFNVNDVDAVKNTQSDINNFVSKFLDKNNMMNDANGYHKSLFTAMNSDAVANHFYQQGKADAIKETMAKAKNVDMSPRETGTVETGGMKVRALGDDTNKLRFKIKN